MAKLVDVGQGHPGFNLIDFGAKKMPERAHPSDAGMDIYAPATFHVPPHKSVRVNCGFGITMPDGYMAYTVVRGSTANMGLHVAENPIDAGYTGEVHAVVWNISSDTVVVQAGERFCQLVIVPCVTSARNSCPRVLKKLPVIKPEEVAQTERGDGGYGSTNPICDVLYANNDPVAAQVHEGPDVKALHLTGEVIHLEVHDNAAITPNTDKGYTVGISSKYDPVKHTVTVTCDADVITLGITARVLQRLYMKTACKLPIDVMSKVHMVVEEVLGDG